MSDYLMSVRCAAPALVETVSHYQRAVVTLISMTQCVDTRNISTSSVFLWTENMLTFDRKAEFLLITILAIFN